MWSGEESYPKAKRCNFLAFGLLTEHMFDNYATSAMRDKQNRPFIGALGTPMIGEDAQEAVCPITNPILRDRELRLSVRFC